MVPASTGFAIAFLVFVMPRIALIIGEIVAALASHAEARGRRGAAEDSAGAEGTVVSVVSKNVHNASNRGAAARCEGGESNDLI